MILGYIHALMIFLKMRVLSVYILFLCYLFTACSGPKNQTPPNIIIIMADDLGYGGIGCFGNDSIHTPHLDALAKEGIKFTDFHSNGPVCTPTRAALLTGNYQQRSGLEGVIYVRGETRNVGMDTTQVTIAEYMKQAGYASGIIGKWHLGYKKEYNPVNQGFDEFYGYVSGNIDYHSLYDNAGIYDWWHNLDTIKEKGYVTDLITDHAVDFIQENKEKPFFLYVAHEAPHVPFQGRESAAYRFPNTEFTYYGPEEDRKEIYKEMVEVMDEGIGKIMNSLRTQKLEENTLILFISDNGAISYGDNGNLNGAKGNLFEGGHRVPAIAYWKNKIQPSVNASTLLTMDILPTCLALAQKELFIQNSFDGIDFSDLLLSKDTLPTRTVFWKYRKQKAARYQDWKLLVSEQDTLLFNLSKDLEEKNNVKTNNPSIAQKLLLELSHWEKQVYAGKKMKTQ